MSRRSMLGGFLNLAKAWPICLASAAVAYLTIAGLLFPLAPDIAELIVNGVLTAKLVLTLVIAFLFLNLLLVLTYASSLLIIKRESIIDGLRKNMEKLIKGFLFLSLFNLIGLALSFIAGYWTAFSTSLSLDAFKLMAVNYGAGLVASILFAIPLVWLITSLAGVRLRMGLARFLSVVVLVFLMFTILSIHGLTGLFTDALLIPTIISLVVRTDMEKADDDAKANKFPRLKGGDAKKKIATVILTILILSVEASFNRIILAAGEESMFSEDRLKSLVSKAVAEGWSSEELASAIRSDPGLSMLSKYDLSGIAIERDDAGNVEVAIPLNAKGYAIYRKASNKTTVYDVYSQGGSSEVRVGDKRYVLSGYKNEEKTFGPFEKLEDALAKESEVKGYANATRITSNTFLKTESREVTRFETRYAIVPTVRVARYEIKGEFDSYWDAQNYLYSRPRMLGIAEIKEVEKKVWVYSYELEFERETTSRHEAIMVARDENNYVVEEVRERIVVYVFDKYLPFYLGPIYIFHYYAGKERIRKDVFERMVQTGEIRSGRDLWGLGNVFYYYASEGDASTRLYKVGEEEEEGEVVAWRIYRKIDTSHWETRKMYQVVAPNGHEERKLSIGELPSYAKGFTSREDAESSKSNIEAMLKNWVNNQGMTYRSCEIESYEETVTKTETITKEVKQYYVVATLLKPVYDVYELQRYYKVWEETHYEEKWGWVFKGYVNKTPETYDMATWVYSPEVINWTSKVYLGIVAEWEAQALMSIDPRYVAEKHNTTTVTREISYYDVYNATWRLLYHYYKYVVHPLHEYIANGNISSGGAWTFESLGDASGEICSSTFRSSPSSLRITTRDGRGAWRQTFYFNAGGSNPTIDFWYILSGSGVVAVKKPDGSAYVFTLGGSSGWSRFRRNSGDIFDQAGYYTISFVASENSELFVDDVSVHVGGYGEWVYQGDVE
ncbi:MAG: CvpA family protein, partial [Candidatus Brockarchaeota archaeon]|nr:CvpA family protein [Candidatus Brockarchaeota archaeon]